MALSLLLLLILLALGATVLAAMKKLETWVPVFLLCVILLLQTWPK